MKRYNPKEIEPKWQQIWEQTKLYEVDTKSADNKFYIIPMFPYPSGDLHVGHWYNFAPTDTVARWRRMLGYKVLQANGFDAFGLPAENAAIKRGIPPAKWTKQNIVTMTKQLQAIGASYDWSKQVITNDPDYYKWTQWLFVKLYEKGLAYRAKSLVNWCPKDQTVLANEQVVGEDNVCERCGTPVIQKEMEQWFYKTTEYAERLLDDLEKVDWPQRVKTMQENWIGKSKGAEIIFKVADSKEAIKVFTTRADTIFSAAFIVLAPEHPVVSSLTSASQEIAVKKYVKEAGHKSEIDRMETEREKTGVFTGSYAINSANGEKIPIWVADFVLGGYGTGAVFGDIHDERDFEFIRKFDIPARTTVVQDFGEPLADEKYVEGSVVIPYDPGTDLYLGLSEWSNGTGLVGGGLNKGESIEQCARRELAEETGIHEVDALVPLGPPVYSHYYNDLKKINRLSFGQGYLAIVKDGEMSKAAPESHEKFKPTWQTMKKIRAGIIELGGGVDHWLEMCDRAERAVEAYKNGEEYLGECYSGEGVLIDSGKFSGMRSEVARDKIIAWLGEKKAAKEQINYRLRDWLISRQRYWGTPIPAIYCDKCGIVPVPEDQLPVVLPENVQFEPTGQSPLIQDENFVNTKCPECNGPARRETDTMDTFVDSSWYFLRYPNPNYDKSPFDPEVIAKWGPVDHYIGGIEHAILHLLYSRFITKFLHDHHGLSFDEPFKKLSNEGMILGPDGLKMSKSKGNVVSPDEQVTSYGSDSLRLYLMFMGPYDQGGSFSLTGIVGTRRFLDRLWVLAGELLEAEPKPEQDLKALKLRAVTHRTVKKVTQDLEKLDFNTAIASMMGMVNELYQIKAEQGITQSPAWRSAIETLTQLLAPFAPHITEELWHDLGHEESIHISKWPAWDEKLVAEDIITIVVQVNGKVRAEIAVSADANEEEIIKTAKADKKVAALIAGKDIKREIYVPGRLVNFVVERLY